MVCDPSLAERRLPRKWVPRAASRHGFPDRRLAGAGRRAAVHTSTRSRAVEAVPNVRIRQTAMRALPFPELVPDLARLAVEDAEVPRAEDEEHFLEAVIRHSLLGHASAAAEAGRLELGGGCRRRLLDLAGIERLRTGLVRAQLRPVLDALAAASVAAPLLLKGPAVAERWYRQPELRSYRDLDLLVEESHLVRAVGAVEALGYRAAPWHAGRRFGHAVDLARPLGAAASAGVELHWRTSSDDAAALERAALLPTAERLSLDGGAAVSVPGGAQQLGLLAAHFLTENTPRIILLVDLLEIARRLDAAVWEDAFTSATPGVCWAMHTALDHVEALWGPLRPRPPGRGARPGWGLMRVNLASSRRWTPHLGQLLAPGWGSRGSWGGRALARLVRDPRALLRVLRRKPDL